MFHNKNAQGGGILEHVPIQLKYDFPAEIAVFQPKSAIYSPRTRFSLLIIDKI